ncbi:MAG: hypothetical protein PHI37_05210 [Candidatus Gracilibacteria bacterium]|nr:hypothetical protein [Candidatus Gracilibacteria bacterium]
MKNKFSILILLLLIFSLSSCFKSNEEDISKVKQELLNNEKSLEEQFEENIAKYEEIEQELEEQKEEKFIINYLGENKFIEIDDLTNKDLSKLELEITGKTLVNVDKIVVNFSNSGSTFPVDEYTLKTFKAGDKTFLYRAFKKYETLDYGKNTYMIEAYSGNEVSKIEIIVNIIDETKKTTDISNDKEDKILDISLLPTGDYYGNPVSLGNGKVTYSDIKGLSIEQISGTGITLDSDSINSFLASKYKSWFFWNTLRPISGQDGVSFYVVRLDGEKYYYEKHYYTPSGFYGVLELESGTGVDVSTISDKNTELKDKNETFVIITIADMLFKKILD